LQLGSTEISEDFCPFWRVVISSEIGLLLPGEDFERCRFPDTVCTDETKDLTWPRCRETMKFESIGGVTMGDMGFEIGGKIKDLNGFEGTSRSES